MRWIWCRDRYDSGDSDDGGDDDNDDGDKEDEYDDDWGWWIWVWVCCWECWWGHDDLLIRHIINCIFQNTALTNPLHVPTAVHQR